MGRRSAEWAPRRGGEFGQVDSTNPNSQTSEAKKLLVTSNLLAWTFVTVRRRRETEGKRGRRPTAGQPTAEPSHRPRKERRSSPSFGSEKNVFVLSGAEELRLSRRLAGLRPAGRRRRALHESEEVDGSGFRRVGDK